MTWITLYDQRKQLGKTEDIFRCNSVIPNTTIGVTALVLLIIKGIHIQWFAHPEWISHLFKIKGDGHIHAPCAWHLLLHQEFQPKKATHTITRKSLVLGHQKAGSKSVIYSLLWSQLSKGSLKTRLQKASISCNRMHSRSVTKSQGTRAPYECLNPQLHRRKGSSSLKKRSAATWKWNIAYIQREKLTTAPLKSALSLSHSINTRHFLREQADRQPVCPGQQPTSLHSEVLGLTVTLTQLRTQAGTSTWH